MSAALRTAACTLLAIGTAACAPAPTTTLTVLAASSLSTAFTQLGASFEQSHPGVRLSFSFASSTTVARQVAEGAPADVVATADSASMQMASAHTVSTPQAFASNHLALAVPAGSPSPVHALDDLNDPGVRYAACAPSAPCGQAAQQLLSRAGVTRPPVTLDPDARSTLAKAVWGEVDAAVVYHSDAISSPRVRVVPLPEEYAVRTTYPIAALRASAHPDLAREFVQYVLSPQGQAFLGKAGFASS